MDFSNLTLTAIQAALSSGNYLKGGFRTKFAINSKEGKHNLVTEYDIASEKQIIYHIKSVFPDHTFLAEESGYTGTNEKEDTVKWIIDPLDGTVNFAHGIPFFSVSIAAEFKKEIILGVIYQPMTQELFVAEKNKGAFLNGNRIEVSAVNDLENSILATGFPYNLSENPLHCIESFTNILKLGIPVRRLGVASLDLAYVASSRFDGFFEVSLGPWDCAAGIILIEEAKGKVSHWNGDPFDFSSYKPILVSNGKIHEQLSSILLKK